VTKDELVDLFLKETENTPDGDFAAQLDLFYDVTHLTAERRKAFTAVFKEVDEDDSGGPLRPPPPSPPSALLRWTLTPRSPRCVSTVQTRTPESARRLGMVPADGRGSVCEACFRVLSRSSRRCAVAAVCRDPIRGAVPPRPCIQLEVVARLVRDALQQDRPQQGADVASSGCNAHSAGADVAAFRTAT
jgi:hypothetical protein